MIGLFLTPGSDTAAKILRSLGVSIRYASKGAEEVCVLIDGGTAVYALRDCAAAERMLSKRSVDRLMRFRVRERARRHGFWAPTEREHWVLISGAATPDQPLVDFEALPEPLYHEILRALRALGVLSPQMEIERGLWLEAARTERLWWGYAWNGVTLAAATVALIALPPVAVSFIRRRGRAHAPAR